MATFKELAEQYAEAINSSVYQDDKAAEVVVRDIGGLVYKGSQKSLSEDDKEKIVELTGLALKGRDNQNYLQLVNHMLSLLKKPKP